MNIKGRFKVNEKEKREIYGDLLKLAAEMLGRKNMPSRHHDDWGWPKCMQRTSWLKVHKAACDADEQSRAWGVRVGEIADRIIGRRQ